MKHLKVFENLDIDLEKELLSILNKELYTEVTYYSDREISEDGKKDAVKEIIKYLYKLGPDLDVYLNSKKYNL